MGSEECFEFSEKILARLVFDGVISSTPSEEDMKFIFRLKRIWTNEWYIAQMCKRFRPEKRALILAFPDFNKIERYILNSYLNLEPDVKLPVAALSEKIEIFLGVKNYDKSNIKRIRQIAYNLRRSSRRKSKKNIMLELALLQNPAFFEL